jgi:hypothetical protein
MTKPFEIGALVDELKKNGLELAEESAKIAAKSILNWIEASVKLTENPYDDFFVMARPQIESVIAPVIEQINPEG